jgi:1-acyl-sn-glycerol-3-phosphate acyltransferase
MATLRALIGSPRQRPKVFCLFFSKKKTFLPSYSPTLLALFRLYLRWFFWRRFNAVRVALKTLSADFAGRPLVIYCNHPSWWDPALLLLALPNLLPSRQAYGPMDAAELERYGLFRKMGVFGVEKGTTKGAATFLRVGNAILNDPHALLCVTAEGDFNDPRQRPIKLRRGLAHLARRRPDAVFLPLALEYTFWNESKPEALMRFGLPVQPPENGSAAAWQENLEAGLACAMDGLAEESIARSPAAFQKIFGGTAGVGGIYDLWRRSKALVRGEYFNARHEPGANT